jgi:hypothetical protein
MKEKLKGQAFSEEAGVAPIAFDILVLPSALVGIVSQQARSSR